MLMHANTHNYGPANFEVYDNIIQEDGSNTQGSDGENCYRCIHHQGSNTYVVFNNTLSGVSKSGDPIVVQHYCSFPDCIDNAGAGWGLEQCDGTQSRDGNRSPTTTHRGYPCWRQPGRDLNGAYQPVYSWNNKWSDGVRIDMLYNGGGSAPDYSTNHMQEDREWYNGVSINAQTSASSPFDGTTGMGFGTFARRPTTCTTSSETGLGAGDAGVGYFATDVGAQGTLYTCSATDTWTVYYTPYTYPHPLQGASEEPPDPPTNFRIIGMWGAMGLLTRIGGWYGKGIAGAIWSRVALFSADKGHRQRAD
jgi:hypothetical protein